MLDNILLAVGRYKSKIRNVLNYKKSAFWMVIMMVILITVIIIGVTFNSTNRVISTDKIELTKEQIAQVNKAFKPIIVGDDGNDMLNPISHFLTSYYENPENIDLAYMLYLFPSEDNITEEEFEALKIHDNWSFGVEITKENMPMPIHRISTSSIDDALELYMDISLNDVNINNSNSLIYLEENNAFYNFTSDFAPGFFICNSGEVQGDTVILYGENAILTLRKIDDRYIFVSHVKGER